MDSREANKNSNHPTKFTQLKGTPNSANSKVRGYYHSSNAFLKNTF